MLRNVYKIKIDSNTTYYIDLPLEVGRDTTGTGYQASFGHKVNHSFSPNCRYDPDPDMSQQCNRGGHFILQVSFPKVPKRLL